MRTDIICQQQKIVGAQADIDAIDEQRHTHQAAGERNGCIKVKPASGGGGLRWGFQFDDLEVGSYPQGAGARLSRTIHKVVSWTERLLTVSQMPHCSIGRERNRRHQRLRAPSIVV
jgi:hypothetical protein